MGEGGCGWKMCCAALYLAPAAHVAMEILRVVREAAIAVRALVLSADAAKLA